MKPLVPMRPEVEVQQTVAGARNVANFTEALQMMVQAFEGLDAEGAPLGARYAHGVGAGAAPGGRVDGVPQVPRRQRSAQGSTTSSPAAASPRLLGMPSRQAVKVASGKTARRA